MAELISQSEILRFILSFIQALLKTGYYTPSHPETSRAREGLYNDLLSILKDHREITFVAITTKGKGDVMVDGIVDEPVAISSFMLKGMAEVFVPKFLEYFDRKNLSSFSIKTNISRSEFEAFIDIMSESPFHGAERIDTRERLTLELIKNNVLNVSTIFNIDLVGKERKLPWRVEMALTRLKRDLGLIPLYKGLSEGKRAEIKKMVFEDIVRPIKTPTIIKDILVNLDLISSDIAGIGKEELEERVTDFIHKDHLSLAAPEVLKSFVQVKESYERLRDDRILPGLMSLKTIAKRVGIKIMGYGFLGEALLMDYFNQGVLSTDELPEDLQAKIKRGEEIERFLKEPQKYFATLEGAGSQEEIGKTILLLLNFLPELLMRNLYTEAEGIIRGIKGTGFDFFNIDSMPLEEITSTMEKRLTDSPKEGQMKILEMVDLMDKASTPIFINLIPHNSRLVRRTACERLVRLGKAIIPPLKEALERRKDPYFIRNALMILGEMGQGSTGLEGIFKRFLNHEEPRIRVEAVVGLVNIMGTEAEGFILNALNDRDLVVRRRAVWGMGEIKSVRPEVIDYFINTIRHGGDESLIEQVLSSMQQYPRRIDVTNQFEDTILEILTKRYGFLGRVVVEYLESDHLRAKMCETLGYIGGQRSIPILEKIAKKDTPLVGLKAREAIRRVQEGNA
ncbi:MAG: HEAT repeat domain-containing protein [Deltaproteobacteria bacterium]|nr:HEAT repeat domain-containing protein [Deltaproteobacteria bacterium]